MRSAPLHGDTLALCADLLHGLSTVGRYATLCTRLERGCLALLDAVTLATTGIDRHAQLDAADAELQTLRCHLELAHGLDLLPGEDLVELADACDGIGRQLGGWLRSLDRSPPPDADAFLRE